MPSENPAKDKADAAEGSIVRQSLSFIGKIIAPTTVISALLYYFGWAYADALYDHFGIDQSLLGFSSQDYLLRSLVPAFEPLRWLLILGLALAWLHHWVSFQIKHSESTQTTARLKRLRSVLLILGVGFILAGPVLVLNRIPVRTFVYALVWMLGILFSTYGVYLSLQLSRRSSPPDAPPTWLSTLPSWLKQITFGLIFSLQLFALFWFVSLYANEVGRWQGAQLEANIDQLPCAVVYSQSQLALEAGEITETALGRSGLSPSYKLAG